MTPHRRTRWPAGAALLLLALLAVVLIRTATSPLAGTPGPAPVPSPPRVGDCLLAAPDPGAQTADGSTAAAPPVDVGPCSGPRRGEVVAVAAGSMDQDDCRAALPAYLGLPADAAGALAADTYWYPQVSAVGVLGGPSVRQLAAGQHWTACLATFASASVADAVTVPGPLAGAWARGVARTELGVCPTDPHWRGGQAGACGADHDAEVFGADNFTGPAVTRTELETTCRAFVSRVTGMPDTGAGGALSVQVRITDPDGNPVTGESISASAYALCGITTTGHRALRDSLIKLGSAPVPWA